MDPVSECPNSRHKQSSMEHSSVKATYAAKHETLANEGYSSQWNLHSPVKVSHASECYTCQWVLHLPVGATPASEGYTRQWSLNLPVKATLSSEG